MGEQELKEGRDYVKVIGIISKTDWERNDRNGRARLIEAMVRNLEDVLYDSACSAWGTRVTKQ